MNRVLMTIAALIICNVCFSSTANQNASPSPLLVSAKAEIADLENKLAQAKAAGQIPDPALSERIRELIPLVKNHPANIEYDLPEFQPDESFAPGAVIRPEQLSPLEQQISDLEFQLNGGLSAAGPEEAVISNLKAQLNELYSQRELNRHRNPLDQGNDACPATAIPFSPYSDNGTTAGLADNFSSLSPCTFSAASDVVYTFTPTATFSYTISLAGSSYDTYLYINTSGACPGTVQVACNDDAVGLQSEITTTLIGGQIYYIIVDGYSNASGNYVLNIWDNCSITCQPGDANECVEISGPGHESADCNGGCNNIVYGGSDLTQPIYTGQTVCGQGFAYTLSGNLLRDIDTYRFSLSEPCSLNLTVNSEFGYLLHVVSDDCPATAIYSAPVWVHPCSTVTFITPCFPAGNYKLHFTPFTQAAFADRDYRLRMNLIPCNGCRIDATITAPVSFSATTCGAGNHSPLRPSEDYTFAVNIPYESDWTFSICDDDTIWDSYIYLTSTCNSGVIDFDDDGCGGVGLSSIECLHIPAGTYYLTVEAWSQIRCGVFRLKVGECVGACCYGDPDNMNCATVSPTECQELSGTFSYQTPCSTGACYQRPACSGDSPLISQPPHLPDEAWSGLHSDATLSVLLYDNYSVVEPIGKVKFWGFWTDDVSGDPCFEDPAEFELLFVDSVNNISQTYNVTLSPVETNDLYAGIYRMYGYETELSTPCTITNGWFSVRGTSQPACDFVWASSPMGDGSSVLINNNIVMPMPFSAAFCIGRYCSTIDSATIQWVGPNQFNLEFWIPFEGIITIWSTTDASAVYPAGYSIWTQGPAFAGHYVLPVNSGVDSRFFVVTRNCNPSAMTAPDPNSPFRKIE